MAAPKTVLTYPLNGALKDFPIPFEYLARKFVVVTLLGVARRPLVLNSEYRFSTKTTITTISAWGTAQGFDSIEIRRVTSATERLVDFSDGSILRAYDLNTSQVQSLHIAEEARDLTADTIGVNNDGNLDARSRRIVNLADAVNPGDAVTLRQNQQWAGSALNQANLSAQSAAASEASRQASTSQASNSANSAIASQTSRVASEAARDLAQNYRDASLANAQNAAGSNSYAALARDSAIAARDGATTQADRAKTEADRATAQADRAKTEADKLGNMNDIAANLDSTATGAGNWKVAFKGIILAIGKVFGKKFEAQAYDEGLGFANQYATEAPFFVKDVGLTANSEYRPILKARVKINGGADESVSLGILSNTSAGQDVVLHWGTSGSAAGGALMQWNRAGNVVSVPGAFYAATALYEGGQRVWSPNTFNPNTKLAGADNGQIGSCNRYNVAYAQRYDSFSVALQPYNGAIEIREAGLVANGGPAPGHLYNAPGITFHWAGYAVNKLQMATDGNLVWGNPSGTVTQIATNGNINGGAWGGWLSTYLTNYYLQTSSLALSHAQQVTGVSLGNVAFLQNVSGATAGTNFVYSGSALLYSSHNNPGGGAPSGSWRCTGWSNHGGVACWMRVA